MVAVFLGIGRLVLILALAAVQRFLRRPASPDPSYAPSVSVIVPAFREEKVIARTIGSLLEHVRRGDVVKVQDAARGARLERILLVVPDKK